MAYEKIIEDSLVKGDTWAGHQLDIARTGFDFTGATVKVQFRKSARDRVLVELTPTPSIATTNAFQVVVALTAEQSEKLPAGTVLADVEINISQHRETPVLFRLNVTQDITH